MDCYSKELSVLEIIQLWGKKAILECKQISSASFKNENTDKLYIYIYIGNIHISESITNHIRKSYRMMIS